MCHVSEALERNGASHQETDWKIYKYGLEFPQIAEADRRKLAKLINSYLALHGLYVKKAFGLRNSRFKEPGSYPSFSLQTCQKKEGTRV